jgi:hypothetical protein
MPPSRIGNASRDLRMLFERLKMLLTLWERFSKNWKCFSWFENAFRKIENASHALRTLFEELKMLLVIWECFSKDWKCFSRFENAFRRIENASFLVPLKFESGNFSFFRNC